MASAVHNAAIASAMTEAAGTAHVSDRSYAASMVSLVTRSTERRGFFNVGMGFIAALIIIGIPLEIPPSIPPVLLVSLIIRLLVGYLVHFSEPNLPAALNPRPISTPLIA